MFTQLNFTLHVTLGDGQAINEAVKLVQEVRYLTVVFDFTPALKKQPQQMFINVVMNTVMT